MEVVQLIAPGILAGAERVVLGGSQALRAAGVSTRIVVIRESRSPEHAARFVAAAESLGVPTLALTSRGRLDPALLLALRRELGPGRADLVHAHGFKGAFVAAAARSRRVPLVSTHHGEWPTEGGRVRLYRRAVAWAYRSSEAVVAVTKAVEPRLIQQGIKKDRVYSIENFLHLPAADSSTASSSARAPDAPLSLLFLGRLSREKGCHVLLEALACTRAPCRLDVVGAGPEEERLIHLAAARDLASRVRFHGFVDDVRPWVRGADLLVMPSLTEALPMALIESLCLGTPAVATAVGAVPDVIDEGVTGFVVPPDNPLALARAIDRAAEAQDKLREGVAAAEASLRERFSAERWARESTALYQRLIAERSRAAEKS